VGVSERVERGAGRGTLYNTLLTLGPDGRLLNHHRKLVPTYTERLVWGTGDAEGLRAVDTPAGRVGGLVCWEHWMPLGRQALHESGEDIHVAVWPTAHELHQVASRHYAFEGRCFVLAAGALMRAGGAAAGARAAPGAGVRARRVGAARRQRHHRARRPVPRRARLRCPAGAGRGAGPGRIREESMTLDVTGHYHRPELFEFRALPTGRRSPGAG
jgi:predicted amidohydrolase